MAALHPLHDEPSTPHAADSHPSAEEIRQHLDTILAADEFCSSRRCSELLRHIVERALAGDADSLKERLLGVEIFHRRSDYDTGTDAIVRVTANDARRRLANFYSRHPLQPLRISLPLGSYVPDFIPLAAHETAPEAASLDLRPIEERSVAGLVHDVRVPAVALVETARPPSKSLSAKTILVLCLAIGCALAAGWWLRGLTHFSAIAQSDKAYTFYNDILGPIGAKGDETEIALTNPHVLLYLGLKSEGPPLGQDPIDVPVPSSMAAVLNQTANDNQADFPFHHFFVDTTNYTGMGEATAAFGLARLLQATGRTANLTSARFLNWEAARQEQLVILGAPHESAFVQSTLSSANFTIGYDSIHNAHPLPNEQADYSKSLQGGHDGLLEDYGLIWMTKSPSGTRVLVLAGLSSAGTAGVGEFFSDPERMLPVYKQLRAASKTGAFPQSWQVLLHIEGRQDVPIKVTPVAMRITEGS